MQKALRMPRVKQTLIAKQRLEASKYLMLRRLIKVNHDVATEDCVERPFDRPRCVQEVDSRKRNETLKFGANPVGASLARLIENEEAFDALAGNTLKPVLAVNT